ncbi:putative E3 ubiquitin-protein ligase ATL31 [Iris pallida]|uniref:RING-type E3 ubiquitin transferase n=1 Tax=Iris pallida TaxID=29817 RepID=A0AAX6EUZ6_IRIPA|nr:putative E3 ubiquitin-protein ligase ATL31 [Iris pallida]
MRNLTNEDPIIVRSPYTYTYTSSPMALTVLAVVLALFFLILFALFARRFFSGVHSAELHEHRGRRTAARRGANPRAAARRPPSDWRLGYYRSPPVRTFGLDPLVVRNLPVLAYGSVVGRGRGMSVKEGCVVCLVDFEEAEKVKLIPGCGHVFHPGCIDGWLVLHGSCPICRCSEVCVDLSAQVREEQQQQQQQVLVEVINGDEERGGEDGEERKAVALGRSRSLSLRSGEHGDDGAEEEDERRVSLRRTRSV